MAKRKSPPPLSLLETPWDIALGLLVCALAFFLPFLPDEKLSRIKMQGWEFSVWILLLVAGLKAIWQAPYPEWRGCVILNEVKDLLLFRGRRSFGVPPQDDTLGASPIPLVVAVGVWVLVNAMEFIWATDSSLAAAEMRRVTGASAVFLAGFLARLLPSWRRRFFVAWSVSAFFLSLYGLLQRAGGIGRLAVPQMDRVMGTFGNPIFFAAFLVPSVFLTLAAFRSTRREIIKWGALAALVLELIALYDTQTRAAWIALVSVSAGWGLIHYGVGRVPVWIYVGALLAGGAFVVQTRSVWNRDQGHLLIWRDTLRMAADHPLTGTGLGAFHVNFPSYAQADLKQKWPKGQFIVNDAHNEYLQTLAEGGLPLIALFFSIVGIFFWWLRHRRIDPSGFDDRPWLAAAVAALLIQNFFSADMRFGVSFLTAFFFMGLASGEALEPLPLREPKRRRAAIRGGAAAMWLGLGASVWPALRKPYLAQKEVAAERGFFDQRLLDPAKSIDDLEGLAQRYPTEPAVFEKLAYVYAKEIKSRDGRINTGMAEKAIRAYERLLKLDPTSAAAYNNLANIDYTVGQVDQAIVMWKKAVEAKPDFLDPHLNLGKILYMRGDLKESARHFETVLKLDPGNAEAIVYLKKMVE